MPSLIPFLFLGLVVPAGFALVAPASAAPLRTKIQNMLVLGDSLSAGFGLQRADAYPALLSERAEHAGLRVHIINAGVNGGTTSGGLSRLPRLLDHHQVDVLVVELGINDAFRGVPLAQISANLQKIIDLARVRYPAVKIVIAGMQLPRYSADDYVTQFGAIYPEIARRNDAALVPFLLEGVMGNPALNLPDLIHPNASGQKILAVNVWPVLELALKKS